MCYYEFMKKIICSNEERTIAYENFCDTMFLTQDNQSKNLITSEEYDVILLNADAEYNRIVYGE